MENSSGLDSTGLTLVALTVLFFGISILALVMRLWARKIKRAPVGLDDWLMVASVVLLSGVCANILAGVYTYGGGQVYADPEVSRRKMVIYLQSFYSLPPLYATNITPVKLSVLFLYRRIFPTPDVQRPCTLLIVICLIWWVIAIIGDLLYCIPMRHYWDPTEEGHCFDFPTFFLVMTIADMLIDVAIFATPMPTIRKLHMPLRKRLGVAGILLLGAFVLVTGAYSPGDAQLILSQSELWSVINLGVSILCACAPTYPPLLAKARATCLAVLGQPSRDHSVDSREA